MKIANKFAILVILTGIVALAAVMLAFRSYLIPKLQDLSFNNALSTAYHVRRIAFYAKPQDLRPILESLVGENVNLSYVFILDRDGIAYAHSDPGQTGSSYPGYLDKLRNTNQPYVTQYPHRRGVVAEPVEEILIPTYRKGLKLDGAVVVAVSLNYVYSVAGEYYGLMIVGLVVMSVLILISVYWQYRVVIWPIHEVADSLQKNGLADLEQLGSGDRKDEIGTLIRALKTASVGLTETVSELSRREDELREYTYNLPDLHIKLAPDGTILMVNEAVVSMSGTNPSLLIGRRFWEAHWCNLGTDSRDILEDYVHRAVSGETIGGIEVESLGLSENRMIDLTMKPVFNENGIVRYVAVEGRDITERKVNELDTLCKYLDEQSISGTVSGSRLDFYKNTVYSVTDGKLNLLDHNEIGAMLAGTVKGYALEREDKIVDIRNEIRQICLDSGLSINKTEQLITAAGEAMTNALKHAGGGDVSIAVANGCIRVCVDDYGRGIDAVVLPRVLLSPRFSASKSTGLGFTLILSSVDSVYLATDENGTTVILEKCILDKKIEANTNNLSNARKLSH